MSKGSNDTVIPAKLLTEHRVMGGMDGCKLGGKRECRNGIPCLKVTEISISSMDGLVLGGVSGGGRARISAFVDYRWPKEELGIQADLAINRSQDPQRGGAGGKCGSEDEGVRESKQRRGSKCN